MQKSQAQREQASGVRLVAHLVARPVWLLGVGCQMTGLSFHVVALTRAPVTVVQPIIAAGIVFLVLLAALILHERPRPREFVGIAIAMGGVVPLLSTAGAPAVLVPVTAGGFVGTVMAAGGLMTTMRFLSASTRIERKSTAAVLLGLTVGVTQGMSDALNRLMGAWLSRDQAGRRRTRWARRHCWDYSPSVPWDWCFPRTRTAPTVRTTSRTKST